MSDFLDGLRWKARILIVLGTDDALVRQQLDALHGNAEALDERDMVVLRLHARRVRVEHGKAAPDIDAAELAVRFQVEADEAFQAVLVGKDGTAKWRAARPVAFAEITAVIDAMPMRRAGRE